MGQVIHIGDRAGFNGLAQAKHDLVRLAEIHVHQFAHEGGITTAGGLKLVEIDQRGGIG
jgi:hypothetical protein